MIQILVLAAAMAAPPQAPTPPQAPPVRAMDYAACVAHVAAGGRAVLAVGIDAPPGAYRTAGLTGFANGLYECFLDGTPKMRPLTVPQTMASQPVRQFVRQCVNGVCSLVEVK